MCTAPNNPLVPQHAHSTRVGCERIGIFGGTFDPPHIEHLLAASEVRSGLGLDRVLLMVANRPWQKVGTRQITDAHLRLDMVRAAVRDLDGLEASAIEVERGGESFTVDTVVALHRRSPDAELFVIVGADVESLIPTWKDADALRSLAHLVVVTRDGLGSEHGPEDVQSSWRGIQRVPIHRLDVSSTEIRERVAAGRSIDVLCPPKVVQLIDAHGLYRGPDL